MKPPKDLFGRLPTVADLLENPRIKGLVDRVQEMEITTGVRQFVDRMREEVSRRALDAPIPSIGELADRAARFILRRHATDRPQAINATGQLWSSGLTGPPLADEALASLTAMAQHYHQSGDTTAARLVAELTGGQAALLFSSPAAAVLATLGAAANGRAIVVARGELGTTDGVRLTSLAQQTSVQLIEVGAADSVSIDDYREPLESGAAVLLRNEAMPYALRGQTCRPPVTELVKLADQSGSMVIHNIGRGPLAPLAESVPLDVATVAESLAAGVALVIARGDGYTGGPHCGIVVGRSEVVERLKQSPLTATLMPDPLVQAALAGTLSLYRDAERATLAIPVLARLSTPILNLQSRAERIAPQIEASKGVVSATPVEISASDDLGATRPLPSFGVNIICQADQQEQLRTQLLQARPQLVGVWSGDRVLLDLRTVDPEDDIALVSAFEPAGKMGQQQNEANEG